MKSHNKIYTGLDIAPVQRELKINRQLFGEFNVRKDAGSVHADMTDIWVRYGDVRGMLASGDYSKIADEHDSVWLQNLPECKKICFELMALVNGERLGGVLITKLPPGGKIEAHEDGGWHAEYYSKIFVPIQNGNGAVFGFDDAIISPDIGDAYMFDNSMNHWVSNNSDEDRIAMIVCIKQEKYQENGVLRHSDDCGTILQLKVTGDKLCPGDMQQQQSVG